MDHSLYDRRKYPIVDVRDGYRDWSVTYEQTVLDEMDLRLLDRLKSINWSAATSILDLACGTGRIGQWLRHRSRAPIDGVDLTAEMLEIASSKGVYRSLRLVDILH